MRWLRETVWRLTGARAEIDRLQQCLTRLEEEAYSFAQEAQELAERAERHNARPLVSKSVPLILQEASLSAPPPPVHSIKPAYTAAGVVARLKAPLEVKNAADVAVDL